MTLRTRPAAVDTNAAKTITEPTWLVEVTFPDPDVVRYATRPPITHDSRTFDLFGVHVSKVTDVEATFELANDLKDVSAIVSAHGAHDWPVRIYAYYETDGVLVFDGFLDGCTFSGKRVRFDATRFSAGMATFPERVFSRKDFPRMPVGEKTVKFAGATYTLRGSR